MKFYSKLFIFLCFCGLMLQNSGLRAQATCSEVTNPTVQIGNFCVAPGDEIDVPIQVYHFVGAIYFNFSLCLSNAQAFSVVSATSNHQGLTVTYNQLANRLDFAFSDVRPCPAKNVSFQNGFELATIRIAANEFAPDQACLDFDACVGQAAPNVMGICLDSWNLESPILVCPGSVCTIGSTINISGNMKGVWNSPLVGMTIKNSANSDVATTDANGDYAFSDLPTQGDPITITPEFISPTPVSGLTSFDWHEVRQHVLWIEQMECIQMIAGDCDQDGQITMDDVVMIANSITNQVPEGHCGEWIFMDAAYDLGNCNPIPTPVPSGYPTSITVSDLCQDASGIDFRGVKVGDVNGTATEKAGMGIPMGLAGAGAVEVGPNPLVDVLSVRLALAGHATAEVRVYDVAGALVQATQVALVDGAAAVQLDASAWPGGVLLYEVVAGTERFGGRLVRVE